MNKEELIYAIIGVISVAISSYILGLMPHGLKTSLYRLTLSVVIAILLILLYKGIVFLIKIFKRKFRSIK